MHGRSGSVEGSTNALSCGALQLHCTSGCTNSAMNLLCSTELGDITTQQFKFAVFAVQMYANIFYPCSLNQATAWDWWGGGGSHTSLQPIYLVGSSVIYFNLVFSCMTRGLDGCLTRTIKLIYIKKIHHLDFGFPCCPYVFISSSISRNRALMYCKESLLLYAEIPI